MRCKCGCGRADMKPAFMMTLQQVRNAFGRPMIVNSGFRCPDYNAKVSPKTGRNGPHTTGRAADIKVAGPNAFYLWNAAMAMDMRGFGPVQHGPWDERFLHLDDLGDTIAHPRPRIFTYT